MSTRNFKQQVSYAKNVEFFNFSFSHNKKKPQVLPGPPQTNKMKSFEMMFVGVLVTPLKKRLVNKKRLESSKEELCIHVFVLNLTNVFVQKCPCFVLQEMFRNKKVSNLKKKHFFVKVTDTLGNSQHFWLMYDVTTEYI